MNARLVPVLVAAIVLVATIVPITAWPVGAIQDDATYAILAKSIAGRELELARRLFGHPPRLYATLARPRR